MIMKSGKDRVSLQNTMLLYDYTKSNKSNTICTYSSII